MTVGDENDEQDFFVCTVCDYETYSEDDLEGELCPCCKKAVLI